MCSPQDPSFRLAAYVTAFNGYRGNCGYRANLEEGQICFTRLSDGNKSCYDPTKYLNFTNWAFYCADGGKPGSSICVIGSDRAEAQNNCVAVVNARAGGLA